jgi:hypothetical protein
MRRGLLVLVAAIAAGCGGAPPGPTTDAATGLPILYEMPVFPDSRGATEWQVGAAEAPEGMRAEDTTYAEVGGMIAALQESASGQMVELTIGFLEPPRPDAATILIHASGSQDATVAGDELVVEAARNDRGWYITDIRYRTHCRHGVDPETSACAAGN